VPAAGEVEHSCRSGVQRLSGRNAAAAEQSQLPVQACPEHGSRVRCVGAGQDRDARVDQAADILLSTGVGRHSLPGGAGANLRLLAGPISAPLGSTNVAVAGTSGFKVGQKIIIGYGCTLKVATVTAIGTPGTQARLAAAASAGSTNLKVASTANISAGDTIQLDIGQNTETVTVASVGTGGAHGTGLTLAAPLNFDYASNLPFSDRGTGVTFSPATRFPHSSNEPVLPLGNSISLDQPLHRSFAVNPPVVDAAVTTAGYHGASAPDLWFGGPVLSANAGSMVLRDARGNDVDSLNYDSSSPHGSPRVTRAAAEPGQAAAWRLRPPLGAATSASPMATTPTATAPISLRIATHPRRG
jgi:hypothetical protein